MDIHFLIEGVLGVTIAVQCYMSWKEINAQKKYIKMVDKALVDFVTSIGGKIRELNNLIWGDLKEFALVSKPKQTRNTKRAKATKTKE